MSARATSFLKSLSRVVKGEVKANAPLGRYSSYRIGGPATVFVPASQGDLLAGLSEAHSAGVPVFPLGLGSNVLLPDDGLDALVVRLGKGLDGVHNEGDRWWLGAGLPAPLAARKTAKQGWAGLHLMVGVPGTVGGGVYMNAGCHGAQWADVVVGVTVAAPTGECRVIPREDISFQYRWSGLDGVIVEAEVRLSPGDPVLLEEEVERLFAWRQAGTPFSQPCCGSVFKNPEPPAPPGWDRAWTAGSLLEAAGLKGTRSGGAEISTMHANYFVNTGSATASDVRSLIAKARASVREHFGVELETEVKIIGPSGAYERAE